MDSKTVAKNDSIKLYAFALLILEHYVQIYTLSDMLYDPFPFMKENGNELIGF